jgi:OOP family OmpA-OmpF porin
MRENSVLKITVNGHTDNVGTADYNLNLSKTRAKAVYDYLIKSGISTFRLNYQYYGLTKPIADNDTEEGRAVNRRVEFEIINQ